MFWTLEQSFDTLDELEQYSRMSCLRIAGIDEMVNANTDEIVLDLAHWLEVNINPRDVDRSHRVGAVNSNSSDSDMVTNRSRIRPREIIVKFKSFQATYI